MINLKIKKNIKSSISIKNKSIQYFFDNDDFIDFWNKIFVLSGCVGAQYYFQQKQYFISLTHKNIVIKLPHDSCKFRYARNVHPQTVYVDKNDFFEKWNISSKTLLTKNFEKSMLREFQKTQTIYYKKTLNSECNFNVFVNKIRFYLSDEKSISIPIQVFQKSRYHISINSVLYRFKTNKYKCIISKECGNQIKIIYKNKNKNKNRFSCTLSLSNIQTKIKLFTYYLIVNYLLEKIPVELVHQITHNYMNSVY